MVDRIVITSDSLSAHIFATIHTTVQMGIQLFLHFMAEFVKLTQTGMIINLKRS